MKKKEYEKNIKEFKILLYNFYFYYIFYFFIKLLIIIY